MKHYPSWRYHQTDAPKIIDGPEDEAEGWYPSPALVPELVPGEAVAPSASTSLARDEPPASPVPFRRRWGRKKGK